MTLRNITNLFSSYFGAAFGVIPLLYVCTYRKYHYLCIPCESFETITNFTMVSVGKIVLDVCCANELTLLLTFSGLAMVGSSDNLGMVIPR
jgi:hypothetical protein